MTDASCLMSNFSYIFALLKRVKKERSLIRSFQKSDEKSNRSFALLQRATKERLLIRSFLKSK